MIRLHPNQCDTKFLVHLKSIHGTHNGKNVYLSVRGETYLGHAWKKRAAPPPYCGLLARTRLEIEMGGKIGSASKPMQAEDWIGDMKVNCTDPL